MASGDQDGDIVIWDVLHTSVLQKIHDPRPPVEESEGVISLSWMKHDAMLLAAIFAPALMMLYDIENGSCIWQKEMTGVNKLQSFAVDCIDRRVACLCGDNSVCLMLTLQDPNNDKINIKQYRVTNSGIN